MKRFLPLLLLGAMIGTPSIARALAMSLADSFFPTYGQAIHYETVHEHLGADGETYDGVGLPGGALNRGSTFTLSLYPTIWSPLGTGEFEWMSVWIDWDQSRTWDPSERVVELVDSWLDPGTSTLGFSLVVPNWAAVGETWMRARITFDGPVPGESQIMPAGVAITGEVEDYRIQVVDVIPEPSALALLASGILLLLGMWRRPTH